MGFGIQALEARLVTMLTQMRIIERQTLEVEYWEEITRHGRILAEMERSLAKEAQDTLILLARILFWWDELRHTDRTKNRHRYR